MVKKTDPATAARPGPNHHTIPPQMTAVASSIEGYWIEIGSPQPRQRPRRTSQENTGTFSYQLSECPHRGHRECGRTTDCLGSAPQRRMQTLRKLPITAPNTAAVQTTMPVGTPSNSTRDLVKKYSRRHGDVERLDAGPQRDRHPAVGQGGQLGADTGALVPQNQRDRRAARVGGFPQRLAVGGGDPALDSGRL